jgi:hypothetical protein
MDALEAGNETLDAGIYAAGEGNDFVDTSARS